MRYCESPYFYQRRKTREIVIGDPANGGVVSGGGLFFAGTNATLQASANPYWNFVDWSDGDTNATRTIIVPASNVTFTANFAMQLATVFVATNPANGGTVSGGGTIRRTAISFSRPRPRRIGCSPAGATA